MRLRRSPGPLAAGPPAKGPLASPAGEPARRDEVGTANARRDTCPTATFAVAPGRPLGSEVERWIREADRHLVEVSPTSSDLERADDFGHVTPPAPPQAPIARADEAQHARTTSVARTAGASAIVVAPGWGERVRRA